jgi:hypothetical protein
MNGSQLHLIVLGHQTSPKAREGGLMGARVRGKTSHTMRRLPRALGLTPVDEALPDLKHTRRALQPCRIPGAFLSLEIVLEIELHRRAHLAPLRAKIRTETFRGGRHQRG